ncbi:MAG: carbohydrate kinase [Lachnospiraceae bacterium]|nr:carbohydrate kinase [Lachnospiraceae bacterium]
MNNVLVAIGEALIDFIPKETGCSFDEVTAFSPKIGGAPANVCGAYAKLGGTARMITQVGDDPFGHKIVDELSEAGVDVDCISLTDSATTALAFVSLGADGGRTFSFYRKPSADMLYSPENLKEEYFDNAYVLHFCSVDIGDFPMKAAHKKAIEIIRKKGGIVSFDPNLRFNLWDSAEALKAAVLEFIPLSDIVKISDEELEFITGESDVQAGIAKIFDMGVKLVLYTCGSNGAYAYTKKADAFAPSQKVKAVDTTGAGDGFTGAFLWKLSGICPVREELENLTSEELAECVEFSNKFCAISVQRAGAIASYPTADEVE